MSSHVPGPLIAHGTQLLAIDHGKYTAMARIVDKRLTVAAAEQNAAHLARCFNQHEALVAVAKVLAEIPLEEFGFEPGGCHYRAGRVLHGWNGYDLKVEHVLAARQALKDAQP